MSVHQGLALSIIIPTYNERENIGTLLDSLMSDQVTSSPPTIEILVVDGGSHDGTADIAQEFEVSLFNSQTGRGYQLALGVEKSHAPLIWFLHADSSVNAKHIDQILLTMNKEPQLISGNFAINFDGGDSFSTWLNRFYRFIRRHGFYYGDSGIFVRRDFLERIGGISQRQIMEDYQLVRKLERFGQSICIENPQIISSARRFKGRKKSHIILGWIFIHLLYYFRFPDSMLAKLYKSLRV